ncbi:PsbP-related protein [Methanobacterium alcaliphilum]|uniref:PsbP-related protein n=1 Tax=Methanobacterium alcaliphilum TaxID=392018 RepID=UPI00200A3B09|nr:PsbP-related protein [Methanobacterium alcaliphilum]MCK9152118.1 zinc-ribbon domain-containing protein [Methanobacterium alcaliphilum]
MLCPRCGTENKDNEKFCKKCSNQLAQENHENTRIKKKNSRLLVVLGYIFAVLSGIIGVVIGVYLYTRDNSYYKVHGRNIIIVAALVIIIGVGVSVFTFQSLNNLSSNQLDAPTTPQIETSQYSDNVFSFNYPKTWVINDTQSDSTGNAVYILDPQFAADSNALKATAVGIIYLSESSDVNKDNLVNDLTSAITNRVTTQKTTVTVDGVSATQSIVEGDNSQGHKSQYKIINWEKEDKIYIIACLARGSDLGNTLDSQKAYFDVIINSFQSK